VSTRLETASRVLAGFAANPAVFAQNGQYGWSLVNATDEDLSGYAIRLADTLIKADEAVTRKSRPAPQAQTRHPVEFENAELGDEGKP